MLKIRSIVWGAGFVVLMGAGDLLPGGAWRVAFPLAGICGVASLVLLFTERSRPVRGSIFPGAPTGGGRDPGKLYVA